jgi:hypothetical protein
MTFVVSAATLIAALVLSTTALAASDTNPSPGGWSTTVAAGLPSTLAPGATEQIRFVVTNGSQDTKPLNSVTAAIPTEADGDAETIGRVDIPGCLARWFTASVDASDPALPPQVTAGASYAGRVNLTMRDSGTDQDACRGAAPAVSVTAG